jgi:hypothetical protein
MIIDSTSNANGATPHSFAGSQACISTDNDIPTPDPGSLACLGGT